MSDALREILAALLPFEWARHGFMLNALGAILVLSPLLGALSTLVVSNRLAYFSDAVGHSALTGVALGSVLGLAEPGPAVIAFSLVLALAVVALRRRGRSGADTVIGIVSSTAVALGIVVLSRGGGFARYSAYLVGDILSVRPADLVRILALAAAVWILWALFFNKLLLASVNEGLARSRGLATAALEYGLALAIAAVVASSIRWTGILVINALLALPGATARNLARGARSYHALSVAISLATSVAGLVLSFYLDTATGATMVLVGAAAYGLSALARRR
jgi:zinc transport system permease protein